ncbi:hypothetical protein PG995_006786 [Apiospora arundinis]
MEIYSDIDINDVADEQLIGRSSSDSSSHDNRERGEHRFDWHHGEMSRDCYNPIAVVGMACRLPGHSNSPRELWDFMMRGGIADNATPATRFNLDGHFDGSRKPYTMKTPGAMFMESVDPIDFDAQFFSISNSEASSMDPQQRILMEVIDPEDRNESPTMGTGRSLLSNRISHFLNIHGPSAAIDTACSSALTALDMACVYLRSNQVDGMVVGGANMYLSPERNQDMGAMRATASPTGRCHAFDRKADGYVAAEAINVVYLKRMRDALRDGDPIRAIIRGTSVNSAGRTPGMAMPSAQAQAAAIRDAYINAGIPMADLNQTGYVECHGTGTLVGDPIEVEGLATIFAPYTQPDKPLLIGSVKSNVGHSEAAAGLTSLIKVVLAMEHGVIPGTASFNEPNPKIDFQGSRTKAFRNHLPWPVHSRRRASINSFGFGGSNAHAVVESPQYLVKETLLPRFKSSCVDSYTIGSDFFDTVYDDATSRPTREFLNPTLIVVSANDEAALKGSIKALSSHLLHPGVDVSLDDLAYTLSERRSRLYHRAYSLQTGTHMRPDSFTSGKTIGQEARVGFVFTGQGAEWPMMGKDLLTAFPVARATVIALDRVLADLPHPPAWSLTSMLMDHCDASVTRDPAFSQPLVTALQVAYLSVLKDWGSTQWLSWATRPVAFFRGQATKMSPPTENLGMMAVGVPVAEIEQYIDGRGDSAVQIACFNSPRSLTLSGTVDALEEVMGALQRDGHFARMLKVDMAYHSTHMNKVAGAYTQLLEDHLMGIGNQHNGVSMFSSVTGKKWDGVSDTKYWVDNMRLPVRFHESVGSMIGEKHGPNFLIEIGPSNTLAGPVAQILDTESHLTSATVYAPVAKRGPDTMAALYDMAGKLFMAGGSIDLYRVNELQDKPTSLIIDLPNYQWNHSRKHWHESLASKDWRFRPFARHDLLGTKILGAPWHTPVWQNRLRIENVDWLKDHKLGNNVIFPGAAYVCMAMAAVYQALYMTAWKGDPPTTYTYQLRNIRFLKTLILGNAPVPPLVTLSLTACRGMERSWYEFKVSATSNETWSDHASGLIRIDTRTSLSKVDHHIYDPFQCPSPPSAWYRKMSNYGFDFGPAFRKIVAMDYTMGQRTGRAQISLQPPASDWAQSGYPLHPTAMDGCFQSVISSMWEGDSSNINAALVPLEIDSLIVPSLAQDLSQDAYAIATSDYVGVGRKDVAKNYSSSCSVYNPNGGELVLEMKGMRYAALNTDNTSPSHAYCQLTWDLDITMTSKLFPLWLESPNSDSPYRHSFLQYTFMANDTKHLLKVKEKYKDLRDADFRLFESEQPFSTNSPSFQLAIVTISSTPVDELPCLLSFVHSSLEEGQFVVLFSSKRIEEINDYGIGASGFDVLWQSNGVTLARKIVTKTFSKFRDLVAVHFTADKKHEAQDTLASLPCRSISCSDISTVPSKAKVIVLDELRSQVMSTLDGDQWALLQGLIAKECDILWVTSGAQFSVAQPTRALTSGLFRTVRNETPFLRIINLDTEGAIGNATNEAISRCLELLDEPDNDYPRDSEFVERGGNLHISRVLPDSALNAASEDGSVGKHARLTSLATATSTIRLQAGRVGNLDSLQYSEVTDGPAPLPAGFVEIQVMVAGVNFKDVASVIGLVPENEHLLGGEGSGVIARTAPDVLSFRAGDRVAFFKKGAFGNRVQASVDVVHAIPDGMGFEEAATIPCVFMTCLCALVELAGIKRGDRVLIHSATGGVGLAAIQLCRYFGAEIYATVGTEEKRDFLRETYRIPDSHIFSSRDTGFASGILQQTGGKGVNTILNSLSGELLHESWRVIAKGGTMVEIGKRDILDRNMLSMEPFGRNASFRALDLSHDQISDSMVARLLSKIFRLIHDGHIHPIKPLQRFSFTDIPSALHRMRSGKHIGKLVISRVHEADVKVPVRSFRRELCLRSDVCYLIVGGLRGLCSSIAVWMAKHGARRLAVMSRSGHDDDKSKHVARNIRALGCQLDLIQGDVTNVDDVRRVIEGKNIGGILQASMVLRDSPFGNMTLEDYTAALRCKVGGTWNLHNISLELGLPLDFFTMLSSVSGICGNKGQANYAAANAFLDAFANYRRGLGLPASSVDLGVVSDVGYMADREELRDRYEENVWHPINDNLLREIFGYSLQRQMGTPVSVASATHMITGLQVPQPNHSPLFRDARFSALFGPQRGTSSDKQGTRLAHSGGGVADGGFREIQALIRFKAEAKKVLEVMNQTLNRYLMKILRLTEPLDFARPVSAYGIDSLAAVEVRNLLRVELGADLTTLDILATIRFGGREPANHDFENTCLEYENTDYTIDLVCEALRKLARKWVLEVIELTNELVSIDLLRNRRQQSGTDSEEEQEEEWPSPELEYKSWYRRAERQVVLDGRQQCSRTSSSYAATSQPSLWPQ